MIARGRTLKDAAEEIGQVVEGVSAARAVLLVARRVGVEMPIAEQVALVLYEGRPMREAVRALMGRELRAES